MINLYCNSYNGIIPRHYQQNQHTLMCGSIFMPSEMRNVCISKGYILDNTFYNISHLNHLLGDLTGLYWVWKNTTDEFVGVNQYCRFYDDDQLKELIEIDKNTLYVSNFVKFKNLSIWEQFNYFHTDIGIRMLYSAIKDNKISITEKMADNLNFYTQLSTCNSFFAHRKIFDKVCYILFEIIFELYNGSKYLIEHIQNNMHLKNSNDKRLLAFLSERILNIIYHNIDHFIGKNIMIKPINFNYIE